MCASDRRTDTEEGRLTEVLARDPALGGGAHDDHSAAQASERQSQAEERLQKTQRAVVEALLLTLNHLGENGDMWLSNNVRHKCVDVLV